MTKDSVYWDKVRVAAARRDGEPLYNGSLDHATTLAEAMFAHANNHVNILTGELNARVFGGRKVVENAINFLSKPERKIRVIIEDFSAIDARDHPFTVTFGGRDDVEFRSLPKNLVDTLPYHFIEVDGDSYRYEKDKTRPEAVAAFGDPAGGAKLEKIFDILWKVSETIEIKVP